MRARAALTVTVWMGLACGGIPDLQQAVGTTCGLGGVTPTVELAELQGPMAEVEPDVLVEIDAAGFRIDGQQAGGTPAAFVSELTDARQRAAELRQGVGDAPSEVQLVAVAADVSGARVVAALQALSAAEVGQVRFLLRSPDAREPVVFLDPEYASDLEARLDEAGPDVRMSMVAAELDSLLVACPPGKTALAAVAMASAETRCELLVAGMEEALPVCPLTNGDRVATAMQVAFQPLPYDLVALDLTLASDGEPFEVDPDETWGEVAERWSLESGGPSRWVLAGDGSEDPADSPDSSGGSTPRRPRETPRSRPEASPPTGAAPAPRREAFQVSGGLDKSVVGRVLQRHRGGMKACHDEMMQRNPSAAGRLVVRIEVGGDGSVASARVTEDGVGSSELSACMVGWAKRMTFPAPQGGQGAVVTLPMVLGG